MYHQPLNIYEVHLGSWRKHENGEFLDYRDMARQLAAYVKEMGYTAVELLQITQVLAKNKGYTLAEACTEPLLGYYARWQESDARTAGNGRLARDTLEKAIFHQSRRLVAEPAAALDLILPSDLELKEP